MGITIIQKSDLSVEKPNAKVALVLAGGAVTGGAFKLGGLKALDDLLVNRKTTEFDIYVGLSAGSFLAAPLAAGISPAEMIRSLEGKSEKFSAFQAWDFYYPNVQEFLEKPLRYVLDLFTFVPGSLLDFLANSPTLLETIRDPLAAWVRRPTPSRLYHVIAPVVRGLLETREFPFPLNYVPSGVFDNSKIERFLRLNIEANGLENDFKALYREYGRELFIVAMNLDTAERVVFGHNENSSFTISEAVQASTALPGFYKPARIRGIDFVDGGVRRTANVDVAIEHGAELILCYNPFRPVYNRVFPHKVGEDGQFRFEGVPIAARGLLPVLNQVFRTLLHSRLQHGLKLYQEDPSFRGDIIVIEPPETDTEFAASNPLAFWERRWAVQHGYDSATFSFERHFERIRPILASYGIEATRERSDRRLEEMESPSVREGESDLLTREFPSGRRRHLTLAS